MPAQRTIGDVAKSLDKSRPVRLSPALAKVEKSTRKSGGSGRLGTSKLAPESRKLPGAVLGDTHPRAHAPGHVDTGNILGDLTQGQKDALANIRSMERDQKAADRAAREPLSAEFTGKGDVAATLSKAAPKIAKLLVPDATTTLTRNGKTYRTDVNAAGIPGLKAPQGFARRAIEDLVNLPAVAIPSLYVPASAAVQAVGGNTKPAKKVIKDFKDSDPLYALATGDFKKAGKLANEHPGFTALEAFGVKGAAGRTAGRALRAAPKGSAARSLGSVARADKHGPEGSGIVQKQQYSRDSIAKAAQVLNERRKLSRHNKLRHKAIQTDDAELLANAGKLHPNRMSEKDLRKRVDERIDVSESKQRLNAAKVTADVHHAVTNTEAFTGTAADRAATLKRNRASRTKPSAATTLRAQAIINDSPDALLDLRDRLAGESPSLGPAKRRANKELLKQIDKALKLPAYAAGTRASAERYAAVLQPITAALVERGLIAPKQAELAPLIPHAVEHMGAVYDHASGKLTHADGSPLTASAIRADLRRRGIAEPAFVSQAPPRSVAAGTGAVSRPSALSRTGAATREGTFSADPKVLAETAVRAQRHIDAADSYRDTVHEFSHRQSQGKLRSKTVADQAARELHALTGEQWRAVRDEPFANGKHDVFGDVAAGADGPLYTPHMQESIAAALRGDAGSGPWSLIPEPVARQLEAHVKAGGYSTPGVEALRKVNSLFRRTVLATSPSWLAGNLTESALRASLARAGVLSYVTASRTLKRLDEIDPVLAQELRLRAVGGGHYGTAGRLPTHTDLSRFGGSSIEPLARALQKVWAAPVGKHLAAAWHGWSDLVFRQLNGRFEEAAQTAMLGRALRDSPLMEAHGLKLGKTAVDQAARGLTNTAQQAAFATSVRRMYGRYGAYSPGMKLAVSAYTPFIAWTLNAWKFATDVLPRDHPALLALTASAEQFTEEWRKEHGLDLFMKGALPGFLQGSIPISGGRHQRAPFRYTPFGAFGDPLATIEGGVLPQFSGALSAFRGEDWTGKKLRNSSGDPADTLQKAAAAARAFAESTIPALAVGERVAANGPGALNPLKPVAPATKQRALGKATGPDVFGDGPASLPDVGAASSPGSVQVNLGG